MRETWRQVRRCGPCHKVSSRGRVHSMPRTLSDGRAHGGCMLKPFADKDGYRCVKIHGRTVRVHVLVLESFAGPRPEGMEGCHGPEGLAVNDAHVLRWDSHQENIKDKERNRKRQAEGLDLNVEHHPRRLGTAVTVGAAGG